MSFLAPLFLLGGAAIALPILFHLARRTTRERIPFSSLMFLQPTPPRVTRRSRLEHLLLLLFRCLALCLLALGFARPFIQHALSGNPAAARGKRMVILLDTSASMRREGIWPAAQAKADQLMGKITPADQVAIFTFDRQPRAVIDFEQWDKTGASDRVALARKRLAEINPGWSATHLGNALITAAEALELASKNTKDSPGFGQGEIVVVSDLQEGSHLDGFQGYEWPRGLKVTIEKVAAKPRSNAGLHWVADTATTASVPRIRVSNATDSRREQFQVRWKDRVSGQNTKEPPVEVYVPPGQSRIAQAMKLGVAWTGETLVLTGDDEPFDNVVYWLPPVVENSLIIFIGNERENDPAESLFYLKHAFQETDRQTVRIATNRIEAPLLAEDLSRAQLVILTGNIPPEKQRVLRSFMDSGKFVFFALGTAEAAKAVEGLTGAKAEATEHAAPSGYAMLNQIDFEHPLFASFADPRFSDFTRIHFWKHRRLAMESLPNARILCRFDDGDPAILEIPVGKGRLVLMASGWKPADSQLALSSKFVPLLYSLLEQSRGTPALATQYAVDDPVPLDVLSGADPIRVQKPDGASVELDRGNRKFTFADQPGIYTAAAGQRTNRFAVNLAPEESRTAVLAVEELERLRVPITDKELELAQQMKSSRDSRLASEIEGQQKLWRWLIVAALIVLTVEMGLAGWSTRRTLVN